MVRLVAPDQTSATESALRTLNPKIADLPYTGAPISPHDARVHHYAFGYHSDWAEKQAHLIDLVWQVHKLRQAPKPTLLKTGVRLPDMKSEAESNS